MDIHKAVIDSWKSHRVCVVVRGAGVLTPMVFDSEALKPGDVCCLQFHSLFSGRVDLSKVQADFLLVGGGTFGYWKEDLAWLDALCKFKSGKIFLPVRCKPNKSARLNQVLGDCWGMEVCIIDESRIDKSWFSIEISDTDIATIERGCLGSDFYIGKVVEKVNLGCSVTKAIDSVKADHLAHYQAMMAELPISSSYLLSIIKQAQGSSMDKRDYLTRYGIAPRVIQRAVPPLEKRGWIRREGRYGYQLADPVVDYLLEKGEEQCLL